MKKIILILTLAVFGCSTLVTSQAQAAPRAQTISAKKATKAKAAKKHKKHAKKKQPKL